MTPLPDPTTPPPDTRPPVTRPSSGTSPSTWPFLVGIGLIGLGLACFYKVFAITSQNPMLIGVFMLVGGIAEGVHAIFGRAWRDFITDLAPALLYVLCGFIILGSPEAGSFVLSLILTAALVTGAVYRLVASWRQKPLSGWQTLGAAVVITLLVWLFQLWTWDSKGLWVLGTVAGIGLIVTGISWIRRGAAARQAREVL